MALLPWLGDAGEGAAGFPGGLQHPSPLPRQERANTGRLLTYWNNFVPASEPWLADNEQPTLRQARLNGPGSQHTLSHYTESSPSGHIQGISETPLPEFPVIQRGPLFSPLWLTCWLSAVGALRQAPGLISSSCAFHTSHVLCERIRRSHRFSRSLSLYSFWT